jgi:hypothetical protein
LQRKKKKKKKSLQIYTHSFKKALIQRETIGALGILKVFRAVSVKEKGEKSVRLESASSSTVLR